MAAKGWSLMMPRHRAKGCNGLPMETLTLLDTSGIPSLWVYFDTSCEKFSILASFQPHHVDVPQHTSSPYLLHSILFIENWLSSSQSTFLT